MNQTLRQTIFYIQLKKKYRAIQIVLRLVNGHGLPIWQVVGKLAFISTSLVPTPGDFHHAFPPFV